jgi:hypothetical protein
MIAKPRMKIKNKENSKEETCHARIVYQKQSWKITMQYVLAGIHTK